MADYGSPFFLTNEQDKGSATITHLMMVAISTVLSILFYLTVVTTFI